MDFSVVIPAFNERNRLPTFLSRLAERVGSSGAAGCCKPDMLQYGF